VFGETQVWKFSRLEGGFNRRKNRKNYLIIYETFDGQFISETQIGFELKNRFWKARFFDVIKMIFCVFQMKETRFRRKHLRNGWTNIWKRWVTQIKNKLTVINFETFFQRSWETARNFVWKYFFFLFFLNVEWKSLVYWLEFFTLSEWIPSEGLQVSTGCLLSSYGVVVSKTL